MDVFTRQLKVFIFSFTHILGTLSTSFHTARDIFRNGAPSHFLSLRQLLTTSPVFPQYCKSNIKLQALVHSSDWHHLTFCFFFFLLQMDDIKKLIDSISLKHVILVHFHCSICVLLADYVTSWVTRAAETRWWLAGRRLCYVYLELSGCIDSSLCTLSS